MSGPVIHKMQWIRQTRTMSDQWPALRKWPVKLKWMEVEVGVPRHRSLQAALIALDHLNVENTFKQRASVMKVVPKFLRGLCRNAMRVPLEVIVDNPTRRERGWKLFKMLPRMLLHRPPRGRLIPRHKQVHRFEMFSRGEWWDPMRASSM